MQNQTQFCTSSAVTTTAETRRATVYVFSAIFLTSLLFILSLSFSSSNPSSRSDPLLFPSRHTRTIVFPNTASDPAPPSIAYFISGSDGDSRRILRLLYAAYHPRNHYLLHLDMSASKAERDSLAFSVQSVPIFTAAQNVDVIGKADFSYRKGSSGISSALHGAAILLRLSNRWNWFANLNAGDYPIVTQDELLHIFSFLPKDLNFWNHSSYIGWRESRKLKPIIVDPGLYLAEKSAMFYASQKRSLPDAYHLFTGSSFGFLSREVIEYSIIGTDNLPRTVLMYLSNTPSSLSCYFPTILCNSRQFNKTIINDNLHYTAVDKHSKHEPRHLSSNDFDDLIQSGAAFATQFLVDDPVLDHIDREILKRSPGKVTPGGWCLGESKNDVCSVWGDADVLRPGPGARRLEHKLVELLSNGTFRSNQCIVE